jgi:hypothetical protein
MRVSTRVIWSRIDCDGDISYCIQCSTSDSIRALNSPLAELLDELPSSNYTILKLIKEVT